MREQIQLQATMLPHEANLNAGIDTKEGVVGAGREDGLTWTEQCHHMVTGERGSWDMSLCPVPGFRMWMALLCLLGLYMSANAQGKSVPRCYSSIGWTYPFILLVLPAGVFH